MATKKKAPAAVKSDSSLGDLLKIFQTQEPDPASDENPAYDDSGYSTHPQSNRNMGAALDALKGHDSSAEDDMNPPESLESIQARLKALGDAPGGPAPESAPPPNEIDKIADMNRITPTGLAPQAAPTATAPAPLQPLPDPTGSSPPDDIAQLLAQRQGFRDQQAQMSASGDPLSRLLVGLGGSFADGAGSGKGGRTNYAGQALDAYQAPLNQQMAIKMKALDGSIADTNPLIQLAQARTKSGMQAQNQKAASALQLQNQKDLLDYKYKKDPPLTYDQRLGLKQAKAGQGDPSYPKPRFKDYGNMSRVLEGLKAAQGLVDKVHSVPSGKFGSDTGPIGSVKSFFGSTNPKTADVRALADAMNLPIAVTMSGGNAPTNEMLKEVKHLIPNIDKEQPVQSYAKGDAMMHKLFVDAEGPVAAMERANDPRAPEFRQLLESAKTQYQTNKTKYDAQHAMENSGVSSRGQVPPGYLTWIDPRNPDEPPKAFPKERTQELIDAGYHPAGN